MLQTTESAALQQRLRGMRPRTSILLFLAMQTIVTAAFYGFTITRGHELGRSVTVSVAWQLLGSLAWIGMLLRRRFVAQVGFAVAAMVAAVGAVALSVWLPLTAPHTLFLVAIAAGGSAGVGWREGGRV